MADDFRMTWMSLSDARHRLWQENPKLHDLQTLITSFERYGFRDPPSLDQTLVAVNGGQGAFVEGNGRVEALAQMYDEGRDPPPGIVLDGGEWMLPVHFGLDALNPDEALAYALDHNNTTLLGGEMDASATIEMYDRERYVSLLEHLEVQDARLVSLDDFAMKELRAAHKAVAEIDARHVVTVTDEGEKPLGDDFVYRLLLDLPANDYKLWLDWCGEDDPARRFHALLQEAGLL